MSKGSRPRPCSVTQQEYDQRWDAIFNRPTPQEIDDAKAEDEAFQAVPNSEIKEEKQG